MSIGLFHKQKKNAIEKKIKQFGDLQIFRVVNLVLKENLPHLEKGRACQQTVASCLMLSSNSYNLWRKNVYITNTTVRIDCRQCHHYEKGQPVRKK